MIAALRDYEFPATVDWNNRRVVQMLDAAGKCFARRGYADTAIKDIAKKVGVTKSMVHYYFSSKMHLLHEVLSYTNNQNLQRVTEQLQISGEGPISRAVQALKSLWPTVRAQPRYIRLSMEFWSVAARDAKLRARLREAHAATRELVGVGIDDALGDEASRMPFSIDALAALILAVLNGLAIQDYAEPDGVDVDEAFRIFLAALVSGMTELGIGKPRGTTGVVDD